MVTATFRFHAGLNDFLSPDRRHRDFCADGPAGASVKHRIESLGVPHPEVAAIAIDGEPADFARPIHGGERIEVYPPEAGRPAAVALRSPPPLPSRFVADAHLGGLARLLRMAGFDTLYRNDYPDAEVAAAAAGGRIVLTRDRDLLMRRPVIHGAWLRAIQPAAQLAEVVARFGLASQLAPFSRCMVCNAPLRTVAMAEVIDRLPPQVAASQTRFTRCDACGRIYWPGSHWCRMREIVARLGAG